MCSRSAVFEYYREFTTLVLQLKLQLRKLAFENTLIVFVFQLCCFVLFTVPFFAQVLTSKFLKLKFRTCGFVFLGVCGSANMNS